MSNYLLEKYQGGMDSSDKEKIKNAKKKSGVYRIAEIHEDIELVLNTHRKILGPVSEYAFVDPFLLPSIPDEYKVGVQLQIVDLSDKTAKDYAYETSKSLKFVHKFIVKIIENLNSVTPKFKKRVFNLLASYFLNIVGIFEKVDEVANNLAKIVTESEDGKLKFKALAGLKLFHSTNGDVTFMQELKKYHNEYKKIGRIMINERDNLRDSPSSSSKSQKGGMVNDDSLESSIGHTTVEDDSLNQEPFFIPFGAEIEPHNEELNNFIDLGDELEDDFFNAIDAEAEDSFASGGTLGLSDLDLNENNVTGLFVDDIEMNPSNEGTPPEMFFAIDDDISDVPNDGGPMQVNELEIPSTVEDVTSSQSQVTEDSDVSGLTFRGGMNQGDYPSDNPSLNKHLNKHYTQLRNDKRGSDLSELPDSEQCVFCLRELGTDRIVTRCGHKYHHGCLRDCMRAPQYIFQTGQVETRLKCIICRIPFDDDDRNRVQYFCGIARPIVAERANINECGLTGTQIQPGDDVINLDCGHNFLSSAWDNDIERQIKEKNEMQVEEEARRKLYENMNNDDEQFAYNNNPQIYQIKHNASCPVCGLHAVARAFQGVRRLPTSMRNLSTVRGTPVNIHRPNYSSENYDSRGSPVIEEPEPTPVGDLGVDGQGPMTIDELNEDSDSDDINQGSYMSSLGVDDELGVDGQGQMTMDELLDQFESRENPTLFPRDSRPRTPNPTMYPRRRYMNPQDDEYVYLSDSSEDDNINFRNQRPLEGGGQVFAKMIR